MHDDKARRRAIRDLYEDADMTQQQAAEVMGVSRGTLSGWINGREWDERVFREALSKLGSHAGKPVAHILYPMGSVDMTPGLVAENRLRNYGSVPSDHWAKAIASNESTAVEGPFDPGDHFVVSVAAWTMYPALLPRDELVVRRTKGLDPAAIGGIVVAHQGDRVEVARLLADGGRGFVLRPDNPAFDAFGPVGWEIDGVVRRVVRNLDPRDFTSAVS